MSNINKPCLGCGTPTFYDALLHGRCIHCIYKLYIRLKNRRRLTKTNKRKAFIKQVKAMAML